MLGNVPKRENLAGVRCDNVARVGAACWQAALCARARKRGRVTFMDSLDLDPFGQRDIRVADLGSGELQTPGLRSLGSSLDW